MDDERRLRYPTERKLPRALRERLARYYQLGEAALQDGRSTLALAELSASLGIPDDAVAEDARRLGIEPLSSGDLPAGQVHDVTEHLLGLRPVNTAVLVGMGRLGSAIASYEGFRPYGMRIVAVFDNDPHKIGHSVSGLRVLPIEQLEDVVSIFQVRLAVLCVSPEEAQEVAARLVRAGIQAIWNFSPVHLDLPAEIVVRNEDIVVGLAALCRDLREASLRRLRPRQDGDSSQTKSREKGKQA